MILARGLSWRCSQDVCHLKPSLVGLSRPRGPETSAPHHKDLSIRLLTAQHLAFPRVRNEMEAGRKGRGERERKREVRGGGEAQTQK